jgi:hypothetical protein
MTTLTHPRSESVRPPGLATRKILTASAGFWLIAALIGQWAFAAYIAAFYGPAMATGDYEAWGALAAMGAKAYVPGDDAGNRFFGAHALAAGIVALGGALQLIPQVRNRWPVFHRWNGRLFVLIVVGLSLTGFWLVWVRGVQTGLLSSIAISINGFLIIGFAVLTYLMARRRRFAEHQRWALRLYMVSNAQWFMRVGIFAYVTAKVILGAAPSIDGPVFIAWSFGCYLVPLGMAELYLRARDRGGPVARLAVSAALVALTLAMALGIFAFGMFSLTLISGGSLSLAG